MDLSTFSTVFFSATEKKINLNCQNEQHHSTLKCWQLTFTQFLSPKYCFPSKPLTLVQRYATFLPLCEFFPRSAGPEVTPRPNSPCTPQGLSPAYPDPPAHQHQLQPQQGQHPASPIMAPPAGPPARTVSQPTQHEAAALLLLMGCWEELGSKPCCALSATHGAPDSEICQPSCQLHSGHLSLSSKKYNQY